MMGIKRPGGFAEMVAVPACAAVELPDALGFHQAAVVDASCADRVEPAVQRRRAQAGETVLVMGAGGNLGSSASRSQRTSSARKVIAARRLGRARATRPRTRRRSRRQLQHLRYPAEAMRLTGGKGVDVLYDNIANPKVLPKAFHALGIDGRLVTAGAHAGPNVTIDFSHLYHKRSPSRDGRDTTRPICPNASPPWPAQDQAADRAHPAALVRRRGAPPGRIGRSGRARSCSIRPWNGFLVSAVKKSASMTDLAISCSGLRPSWAAWFPLRRLRGVGADAYIPATSVIPDDIQLRLPWADEAERRFSPW